MGTADTAIMQMMSDGDAVAAGQLAAVTIVVNRELKIIPLRQG